MTDRELLELAAKAAGISGEWMSCAPRAVPQECVAKGIGPSLWNPLTDDGDALRLAVKLRLNITFTTGLGPGHADEYMQVCPRSLGHLAEFGPLGSAHETIRRAIVRAAAEIGRTM